MKIINTGDGSNTILLEDIDETYHSRHGAVQESIHVFLKNGFRYLLSEQPGKRIQIFELGLGTGLNAVLTALDSRKFRILVEYTSLEPYPVSKDIIEMLNFDVIFNNPSDKSMLKEIHSMKWEEFKILHPYFKFRKLKTTIQDYNPGKDSYNLVYFDAFAPNKQPEIWHKDILKKVFNILSGESVFVTYCAQGQVKRDLREIGFTVESLQGPPGKKEMIRAIKY
jgi:tRNA U34 5-methylaminomethyl-2-thiouridine-forming methyltransferase MnmC